MFCLVLSDYFLKIVMNNFGKLIKKDKDQCYLSSYYFGK